MMNLKPCKIACENWWWNRKLQLFLHEKYNVNWSMCSKTDNFKTFNTRRRGDFLFVLQNPNNLTWWFNWGTEWDFANCDLPEYTAKELLEELS
jgi:hypothetical protein